MSDKPETGFTEMELNQAKTITKQLLRSYLNDVNALALLIAYDDKPHKVYFKVLEIISYQKVLNSDA